MTNENQNIELNNQEENSINENINPDFIKEDPTLNQVNQMEVHHAHHPSHKKKWNEYLLEFLMLFLAVYLGFLAENYREHYIEEKREKEYMKSLINDLKADSTKLGKVTNSYTELIALQDSLITLFPEIENGYKKTVIHKLSSLNWFPEFIYTDATIQQLKNAGNFRLIRNRKVVEKIMNYDSTVRGALSNERNLTTIQNSTMNTFNGLFNLHPIIQRLKNGETPAQLEAQKIDLLFTHDKALLNFYFNQIHQYNGTSSTVMGQLAEVKKVNAELMSFIKKEYDLNDK